MPQKSYPFASVIIKAKEQSILGKEKIARLAGTADACQASCLLTEWGYGGGELADPHDYEKLIVREMKETHALVKRITPDSKSSALFFLQYDYHNLKVLYKSQVTGIGGNDKNLSLFGNTELSVLLDAIAEKKYTSLSLFMQAALAELDRLFSIHPDASQIDILLDRAYAQEISAGVAGGRGFVERYFHSLLDWENIRILLRAKAGGLPKEAALRALLPGGRIRRYQLENAFDLPPEEWKTIFAHGEWAEHIAAALDAYIATGSMVPFEKKRDDYLLRIALQKKNDLFSAGPLIGYWLSKGREAKAIKTVMVGKLNGVSAEEIQKRLVEV